MQDYTQFWILLSLVLCILLSSSCDSNRVYDNNLPIPDSEWTYANIVPFEVNITDTLSTYNVYVNIRHTNEYAYRNIWVKVYTTFPSGKQIDNLVDLPLANKAGKWHGTGSGDIISSQILIQPNAAMPDTGTYKFAIQQNMRIDSLPEILDVGLRVEKHLMK